MRGFAASQMGSIGKIFMPSVRLYISLALTYRLYIDAPFSGAHSLKSSKG